MFVDVVSHRGRLSFQLEDVTHGQAITCFETRLVAVVYSVAHERSALQSGEGHAPVHWSSVSVVNTSPTSTNVTLVANKADSEKDNGTVLNISAGCLVLGARLNSRDSYEAKS
jgi:hypothetical protein